MQIGWVTCVIFILQELDDITKAAGNSHEYFIEGLSEGKTLEEAKEYLRGTVYTRAIL